MAKVINAEKTQEAVDSPKMVSIKHTRTMQDAKVMMLLFWIMKKKNQ